MMREPKKVDPTKVPWLHVHSQAFWHDGAFILGTQEGLEKLRQAIVRAQEEQRNSATETVFVNDGEGYQIFVLLLPYEQMMKMATPYTAEEAQHHGDGILPGKIISWKEGDRLLDIARKAEEKNDEV